MQMGWCMQIMRLTEVWSFNESDCTTMIPSVGIIDFVKGGGGELKEFVQIHLGLQII